MVNNSTIKRCILDCNDLDFQFRYDFLYGYNLLVALCFICVISFLTVISNIAIIRTLTRNNIQFKTPAFFLIKITCVIDTINGIRFSPSYFIPIVFCYQGRNSCTYYRIFVFFGHYINVISISLVTLISIDRYLAILHPYVYSEMIAIGNKVYKFTVIVVSTVSLIFIVISFVIQDHTFLVAVELFYILLLLILNVVLYVKIQRSITQIDKNYRKRIGSKFKVALPTTNQRKGALSSFLFVASLYIHYIPYTMAGVAFQIESIDKDTLYALVIWAYIILETKAFINPMLYIVMLKSIRKKLYEKILQRV